LISLRSGKTGGFARISQALDFSGFRALAPQAIPKVIHNKARPVQTVLESMTYPGFRDVGLSATPKVGQG
jgi:hypothetical protein